MAPPKDTLYYDGQCGLCRGSVRFFRAIDWLKRLDYQDMARTAPDELPVEWEEAMRGIPMRTRSGDVLVGYDAVRRAMLQTPLGILPGLVMYLPGISHVGRRVYRWIAANRPRDLTCDVHGQGGAAAGGAEADDGAQRTGETPVPPRQ